MGENATDFLFFNLTMFMKIEVYRYPAFVFCLLIYCFIIVANLVIITVISREKSLHEPMYIFIACLSVNALYGSAGFFPRFLMDLMSDTHLIPRQACFIQVYTVYSFVGFDLITLGVMAYDRYAAVCYPLHYHKKMKFNTVITLTVVTYCYPVSMVLLCVLLSARLPLCDNKIQRVFCSNWSIVKLSCGPTPVNNLVGMILTITFVFIPLTFVCYTYLRILIICWKASAEYKGKIFQNCLPHIISFTTFCIVTFCDVILSRIDLEKVNPVLAVLLSVEFVIITPIVNPLVYGLKLPKIRKQIITMLSVTSKNCK